ncbi:2'-deoxynucleoside 5'-phosphate N-hydrolase 1 [Hypanus sabinus]|uniref:2'-deoxynucleoside 5'-phosphate N-hydrolase 1 n=1 Tax=Hypanus sabinus TaxID=79690 RepID=UPI0028C47719|nr:2'-deoxynucleoside 5'-phosphate N-hydrolase 1 [Hypanus sabinus]
MKGIIWSSTRRHLVERVESEVAAMSVGIYFCGSIRGGRQDVEIYSRIIGQLKRFGKVFSEHVGHPELNAKGEGRMEAEDKCIHDRDLEWLQEADVMVAEVTQPSLGVGYEIGRAVAMNKKILCLFRPSSKYVLSAMIRGAANGSNIHVKDYSEEKVETILQQYFEQQL